MKRYKEIKTIKTINLDTNEEEVREYTKKYVIKSWNELTDEQKEEEIRKNSESIYELYQDDLYNCFKCDLDYIQCRYEDIGFENVYIDSNSQGNWIDSISKFQFNKSIEIYGETIEVYDIDFHICKYIKEISEDDICYYDYYISNEKLEKIKSTKKWKNFISGIVEYINKWIEEINSVCSDLMKKEYYYPYNIHNDEDLDYLNYYFEDTEFIYDLEGDE